MSKKDKAKDVLENIYLVHFEEKDAVDTNNGILNAEYLTYQKRRLLKNAITYLTDDLVKHRQEFPNNNISDVNYSADFVVMQRKDFDELEKLIEGLDE